MVLGTESDEDIAAAWSASLVDAIVAAVRAGGPDVRWFASRHGALADAAVAAIEGRFADAWAWVQAGVWPDARWTAGEDTATRILDALLQTPEAALTVLVRLAHAPSFARLLTPSLVDQWERLAARIEVVHHVASLLARAEGDGIIPRTLLIPVLRRVEGAWAIWSAASAAPSPRIAHQLERLALIAARPSLPAALPGTACGESAPSDVESADQAGRRDLRTSDAAPRSEAARSAVVLPGPRPSPATSGTRAAARADDPALTLGETSWGGVLFLVHVVRALHLPERHADGMLGESLSGRSLRWLLHQLAMLLAPVTVADPAALAFAGLPPDAQPPDADALPPSDDERGVLASLAAEFREELIERLPDLEPEAVLQTVGRRSARIVAEAGWIVAYLALGEVRTDVRRVGLDLDPGWLPFLGVTLRFVYE